LPERCRDEQARADDQVLPILAKLLDAHRRRAVEVHRQPDRGVREAGNFARGPDAVEGRAARELRDGQNQADAAGIAEHAE
jgi:hypothetical protein